PEYMAEYARRFVDVGVRLIGGCCGTTPDHIHVMKAFLRAVSGGATARRAPPAPRARRVEVPPLRERSQMGRKIADGEFITMVEIVPPRGTDGSREIEGARFLKSVGVDGVNIPDSPRASARMSNQALCLLVQQQVGIEAILHYTCRDRNVLGIQSDLLGASAVGIRNLICITGDPPKMGGYPIGASTGFVIAVGANPGSTNIDEEIRRFEYKVEAGAELAVTQPVFDIRLLEEFLRKNRALPHS